MSDPVGTGGDVKTILIATPRGAEWWTPQAEEDPMENAEAWLWHFAQQCPRRMGEAHNPCEECAGAAIRAVCRAKVAEINRDLMAFLRGPRQFDGGETPPEESCPA